MFLRILDRRQVPERAVGSMSIVVDPPGFDLPACIFDGSELRDVQTLVAEPTIERLYVPVLSRFSGVNKVELYAATIRPFLERLGSEFRAMITGGFGS